VVQVVVYIGAIAILFIFAVMLTRKEIARPGPQLEQELVGRRLDEPFNLRRSGYLLQGWSGFSKLTSYPVRVRCGRALGEALISPDAYVLPFEVASVLLVAALVGAVYVAFNPVSGTLENRSRHGSHFPGISFFAAALFSIGLFGVLARRNAIAILLGIELMLNAVNINLVAFWRYGMSGLPGRFCDYRFRGGRCGSGCGPGAGDLGLPPPQHGCGR
jgi:hypothetical protein